MKVLVLDNYDSFTYNLVQYVQEILERKVDVIRNDAITVEEVAAYDVIILSPGPGLPEEAGIMPELIKRYAGDKFILGVCLGHQAIGEAFGGSLENLAEVYHGIETNMLQTEVEPILFKGIPKEFRAGRYHSWVIKKDTLPEAFLLTAVDQTGEIMAIRHREYPLFGVQFHPESIMTPQGYQMLENFFAFVQEKRAVAL
ncbi:MAG: anthranilate synthase component II [Lewinella sp.]|jgi:anthranilate synthase component 2|uniref:anthranilate synthase component II n=1 Tax=Lewinella sp. TaxID=2004506 RepID=UPI003D6A5A4F